MGGIVLGYLIWGSTLGIAGDQFRYIRQSILLHQLNSLVDQSHVALINITLFIYKTLCLPSQHYITYGKSQLY